MSISSLPCNSEYKCTVYSGPSSHHQCFSGHEVWLLSISWPSLLYMENKPILHAKALRWRCSLCSPFCYCPQAQLPIRKCGDRKVPILVTTRSDPRWSLTSSWVFCFLFPFVCLLLSFMPPCQTCCLTYALTTHITDSVVAWSHYSPAGKPPKCFRKQIPRSQNVAHRDSQQIRTSRLDQRPCFSSLLQLFVEWWQ